MIELLAAGLAAVLFLIPVLAVPASVLAVAGLIGLLLVGVAIAARWRWAATAAACVFVADYGVSAWTAGRSAGLMGAAGIGAAVALLLWSVDMSRRLRGASVHGPVVVAHLVRWVSLGAIAITAAVVGRAIAGALATAMPPAAAPLLAALGAVGTLLVLATAIARAAGSGRHARREQRP